MHSQNTMSTKNTVFSQKKDRFLSAPKFAVVGASSDPSKNGTKALKWLLGHHKDVVPINLHAPVQIQGCKCLKTLAELPDPTHTAVSVVVHPDATLEILQQAKALNVFALWLQPGAEDDAVLQFIQADKELEERCIYTSHALQEHASTPVRTRSKPDPLSSSTNLPTLQEDVNTPVADQLPPCLWRDDPTFAPDVPATTRGVVDPPASLAASTDTNHVDVPATLEVKKARFLSAPKFAVVGASTNESKNGSKALKWLVEQHKDVVPINLKATEIQSIKCLKALSELPDPTHTSVSIVVPPKVTLDILHQAKALGIFALWLQPGAEDQDVENFIEADEQFRDRCVYREHALHTTDLGPKALNADVHEDTLPSCLFASPPSTGDVPSTAAPPVASNIAAGVKHALSPPSTPQVNKSLKLSDSPKLGASVTDLGEEIPGLA